MECNEEGAEVKFIEKFDPKEDCSTHVTSLPHSCLEMCSQF